MDFFADLLVGRDAHPIVFKEPLFTEQEMEVAEFFEILSVAQFGCPQPEDDFGYEKASFDRSTSCSLCCIGAIQTKPYFVSGHPKLGRNDIAALFWIYDLLATQRLKNLVEEAKLAGVEFWPLLGLRGNGQSVPVEGAHELYVTSDYRQ